jgi:hypothetical protein
MPHLRRRTPVAVTAVLVAAAGVGSIRAQTQLVQTQPVRAIPGVGLIRLGDSAPLGAAHFPASSYVILSPHEKRYAISTHALSPSSLTLAYKSSMDLDLASECRKISAVCPTGVSFAEAQAHDAKAAAGDHWILSDASGGAMVSRSFTQYALGDVGVPSFQERWIENVSRFLRKNRFSGVFIDNVLGDVSGWTDGRFPAKYGSDAAWQGAMASFIGRVGPALRKQGFFVAANAFKAYPQTAAWWRQIAPATDALMLEYWQQNPNDLSQLYTSDAPSWTGQWEYWESLVTIAQRAGSSFFGLQVGDPSDVRMMRYGRASFLLAWNGKRGAYFFNPRAPVDPWHQAWTADVGRPLGERYRVGVGWRRTFKHGTVIVNPSVSRRQTFELGAPYTLPGGATARSVTLEPTTALILRRARHG